VRARLALLASLVPAACAQPKPPERHFYEQQIQPIFDRFCVGNTSPCHRVDTDSGTALGNLDLTSFEMVQRRRDVLRGYGIYPQPLLLLKTIPEEQVLIAYGGKLVPSEIRHAGGKSLSASSDAVDVLKRWLDNGANRDGLAPEARSRQGQGPCSPGIAPGETATPVDRSSPAYQAFVAEVQPLLATSCSFSTCHGSTQSDFYLTCGEDDVQRDANFRRLTGFIAGAPTDVEQSELLLRPLGPRAGGVSHTGGVFFQSREDETWKRLRDWARSVQESAAPAPPLGAGEAFFTAQVMPVLLRRGCAFEGCHSPNGFNDFRLRPGVPGFLSRFALHRNYQTAVTEFLSLDTTDVRQSRLVKKNVRAGGIPHRAGALLEGPGPDSSAPCPSPFDAATASAFCTVKEWHRLERMDSGAAVSPLARGQILPLAFVSRPPDPDGLLDFDTFRGGADLQLGDAHLGDEARVASVDNVRSALGPCAGLAGRTDLDVRGPEWSYDGERLVFAARTGAAGGFDLWLLDVAAGSCRRLTSDDGRLAGPVRTHNLDPVFAPDGSLVFASTRSGTLSLKRLLPATNLFRVGPTLDFGKVEQMTWLLGAELGPAFMHNGQLTFTAEKASAAFYQLSGRRLNWDLTDYHPLLAQRARSDDRFGQVRPSVDYQQATEIREGLDRNFLVILSDTTALGAGGALATFNRSLGPFEAGRDGVTFLRSLALVDAAATGRPGTRGVYRSPYPLLDAEVLASYAANVTSPTADTPRYDLVAVDPATGARRLLVAGGARSLVEGALGYRRAGRLLFRNAPQLVFGGQGAAGGADAVVHFPDLPMLATLLGANLRRGRNVAGFASATALVVYEERPPVSPTPDPAAMMGPERVYTERHSLGSAPLERDGSLKVTVPSGKPLILELVDKAGAPVFTMTEEHQFGPGETITPGVPRALFDGVCAGCHGSRSGSELDVAVTPDALTGASVSLSREQAPRGLQ
jgi:Hydrazine synthase alpha subunit middle domain/WD40-like Beta Propeller Repeat